MLNHQKIRKTIVPLLAILIASLGIGVVFAYFTHARKLINKFTVGNNTITITEEFTPPKELKQGINTYSKKVQIKNTGTTNAFVRVYAAFSDSDVAATSFIAANKPKNVTVASDATFDAVTTAMKNAGYKLSSDFWKENGPSNDWIYIPEDSDENLGGYFYYTKSIAPGKSTTDLMNTVSTWFKTGQDVKDYEIIVYAESVQTADKDGVTFNDADYQTAWTEYLARK